MIIDEENNHRRRSSLVNSEATALARSYRNTACFIHTLLEGQRHSENGELVGHVHPSTEVPDQGPNGTDVHSRLLTKRQLSDMAWGVRELSKHLGGIRMKLQVRRIFVLTKAYDESLIANTRELVQWLLSDQHKTHYTV